MNVKKDIKNNIGHAYKHIMLIDKNKFQIYKGYNFDYCEKNKK